MVNPAILKDAKYIPDIAAISILVLIHLALLSTIARKTELLTVGECLRSPILSHA